MKTTLCFVAMALLLPLAYAQQDTVTITITIDRDTYNAVAGSVSKMHKPPRMVNGKMQYFEPKYASPEDFLAERFLDILKPHRGQRMQSSDVRAIQEELLRRQQELERMTQPKVSVKKQP